MITTQVAIVGGGPAGIAAGIQLKRYRIDSIIFEGENLGGLLHNANLIENYPGFPGGISGLNLIEIFRRQVQDFALNIRYEEVSLLDYDRGAFIIDTGKEFYRASIAVIASGTKPIVFNRLPLPEDSADRILYEVKSILDIESKNIAIIGAGDAAFDYALNLARKNRVLIINRGDSVSCLPLLYDRAAVLRNISYHERSELAGIARTSDGLHLDMNQSGSLAGYDVDYLVFAIGREPRIDFLSKRILDTLDEYMNGGTIYFIGDVKNERYRQCSIAIGDGVKAAMMIYNKLRNV
jgi:thioredoxin reductase (NADPH)